MNVYDVDTAILLTGRFFGADGAPADPDTVTLYVQAPDGTVTPYTDALANPSVGVYTCQIAADQAGPWAYKWQGTGAVAVTSPDAYFQVDSSSMIAAPATWPPS